MAGAHYRRNNSYSRSYNATVAETENRYPITRAAQYLGLSLAAFKKGLDHAGISTSEWHHVGKFANRIDYYDVAEDSVIYNSFGFWKGATTKGNKSVCLQRMKAIARSNMLEKVSNEYEYPIRPWDTHRIEYPGSDNKMWRIVRKRLADIRHKQVVINSKPDFVSLVDGKILGQNNSFFVDLNDYNFAGISGSGKTIHFKLKNQNL